MINKTKLLTSLFIIMLFYILMAFLYFKTVKSDLTQQKYKEVSYQMKSILATLINEKKESVSLVALSLSLSHNIRESLYTNDMQKLKLADVIKILEENSSLKNIWIQLIDKEGVSRYRSWTDKCDDSVVKARLDVRKMLQNPHIISSISTGKFDMTFKSMVPIYNKNKFIGFVEVIAKFNSIAKKMQKDGFNLLVIVDKYYTSQLTKVDKKKFVTNYFITNLNPDKKLLEIFKKYKLKDLLEIKNYIVDLNRSVLLTSSIVHDISGHEMGYYLMSRELDKIDLESINNDMKTLLRIIIVVAFLLLAFLYYIYEMQYKNYIYRQNEKLEDTVRDKTKELYYSAHHDALTDLPNRVLFLDRLEQTIKHCSRHKQNAFVLFLDLDHFKEINDTYGHEMGDKLLLKVAQRLKKVMREEDTIARLGGDEFTIIVQEIKQIDIENLVKKIIDIMNKIIIIDTIELQTSFSIGISNYPLDGQTVEILVRNADTAMYKAKDAGKNTYQFYNNEMTTITKNRLKLKTELLHALEHHEFVPYYQPKVNAKTNKVVGIEALIRWQHPTKGLVFPDDFIPFAQEVGLLSEIDKEMRVMSMRQATLWQNKGLEFGRISLNITTQNLSDKAFVDELKGTILNSGVEPSRLEVEILESQSMKNQEQVISVLTEIQKMHVRVAIDDFGTGYSSLSYLQKLPVNTLKIDRSFVKGLPSNKDSITIVKVIISLARKFGLEIIAEGAETKEQVDFLVSNGCENIQGYYYSKPINADMLEAFICRNEIVK